MKIDLGYDDGTVVIEEVAYHRNGVCGEGFFVVAFTWHHEAWHDGTTDQNMMATVFDWDEHDKDGRRREPKFWNPQVAVLDRDRVGEGTITFGLNSWRGDNFAGAMYQAIDQWHLDRDLKLDRRRR